MPYEYITQIPKNLNLDGMRLYQFGVKFKSDRHVSGLVFARNDDEAYNAARQIWQQEHPNIHPEDIESIPFDKCMIWVLKGT